MTNLAAVNQIEVRELRQYDIETGPGRYSRIDRGAASLQCANRRRRCQRMPGRRHLVRPANRRSGCGWWRQLGHDWTPSGAMAKNARTQY